MKYEEEEVVPNAWSSELPVDIVGLISDKLISLSPSEFVRFGAVCIGWRSFCIENYQHIKLPSKLPVLLIPLPSISTTTDYHQIPSPPEEEEEEEEDYGEEEEESIVERDGREKDYEEEYEDDYEEEEDKARMIPLPSLSTQKGSSPSSFEKEEKGSMKKVEEDYGEEQDQEQEGRVGEKEYSEQEQEGRVGQKEYIDGIEEDYQEEYKERSEEEYEEEDDDESDDERIDELYYNPRDIWLGQDYKQRHKSTRNFYSIYEKRVYHDFPLPVPCYKNIRGSSHGWLVTVEECCSEEDGVAYYPVRLFNPFRTDNNEIQLPPLTPFIPEDNPLGTSYYLKKAYLSANPSSLSDPITQLVVLGVSMRNRLAFCRPGDKAWTYVDTGDEYRPIVDIICYQDQFYAILQNGFVFAFILFEPDQLHPSPAVTVQLFLPEDNYPSNGGFIMRYLVESRGELLQVRREIAYCSSYFKTSQFHVFKLDPKDPTKWVETKSLNDSMFFLGSSSTSMSLSALDFPGCKPNSIYYTDDMELYWMNCPSKGPDDIGVFNVEDGSFEPHDALELKTMPPPIWIQPML